MMSVKNLAAGALLVFAITGARASAATFQGKLWVVSANQANNLTFPAPTATPDVTFGVGQILFGTSGASNYCLKVQNFLLNCLANSSDNVSGVAYSNLPNPNLNGNPVTTNTHVASPTYGVIMDFQASQMLVNGETIAVDKDDQALLKIDGVAVPFNTINQDGYIQTVKFTGTTGTHTVELLYSNHTFFNPRNNAFVLFSY